MNDSVDLKEAVMRGLAEDGGLFMPDVLPKMPASFFEGIEDKSFQEISFEVAKVLMGRDIPPEVLKNIVDESFNFDAPVKNLDEGLNVLELYHGPTLAFKDFATRFMARVMSYFLKDSEKELTILVATSGDTGSAVASAFFGVPKIKVIILYPSGKVSNLQEKQLTTYGGNISALEIQGVFDDCQKLVKTAFVDQDIKNIYNLGSANSINIMRLLPQAMYYFYAYAQMKKRGIKGEVVFSVPSGNLGDLTAGVIAKKMGLLIDKFVVACNVNNTVLPFLESGKYEPKNSVQTLSNAMDVGNPSNFARIFEIYGGNIEAMKKDMMSYTFTDDETRQAIKKVYDKYSYIMDPHGAVGYLGLEKYKGEMGVNAKIEGVFLETAHPVKFGEVVEPVIDKKLEIPKELEEPMKKEKVATLLPIDFQSFKNYLLEK